MSRWRIPECPRCQSPWRWDLRWLGAGQLRAECASCGHVEMVPGESVGKVASDRPTRRSPVAVRDREWELRHRIAEGSMAKVRAVRGPPSVAEWRFGTWRDSEASRGAHVRQIVRWANDCPKGRARRICRPDGSEVLLVDRRIMGTEVAWVAVDDLLPREKREPAPMPREFGWYEYLRMCERMSPGVIREVPTDLPSLPACASCGMEHPPGPCPRLVNHGCAGASPADPVFGDKAWVELLDMARRRRDE